MYLEKKTKSLFMFLHRQFCIVIEVPRCFQQTTLVTRSWAATTSPVCSGGNGC